MGFTVEGRQIVVEPLKLAIFHLMRRHLSDILRCKPFVICIIMTALNGFQMTQMQVTLKDIMSVYNVGKLHRPHNMSTLSHIAIVVDSRPINTNSWSY